MEILFVLRKNQRDKSRPATIYCRITLNGERAGDFSTFVSVEPKDWHTKAQKILSSSREANADNEQLENIRNAIKDYFNQLTREGKPVTARILKELYTGKEKLVYSLIEIYQKFIDEQDQLHQVGEVAKNTMKGYRARFNVLKRYLKQRKREDLLCDEFTIKFGNEYVLHLKTKEPTARKNKERNQDKRCSQNAAMRHIRGVSQVLDYAVVHEFIPFNPLLSFPYKFDKPKKPISLTTEELQRLEMYHFASDSLQRVADSYVFMCYTGFAYVDYTTFQKEAHLRQGEDRMEWIYKERGKTDEEAILPLFQKARRILEKYKGDLPLISNQKYNKYIKEAAEIVGIKKNLTTHTARKTAANLWLNHGVPPETVTRMLGQSDVRTLMRYYAQVNEVKIARDVSLLHKMFNDSTNS